MVCEIARVRLAFRDEDGTLSFAPMSTRPPMIRGGKALTAVAFVVALVSVVWSVGSIRRWMEENRDSAAQEAGGRRYREPEIRDGPLPKPTLALAAFAHRRPASEVNRAADLFSTTNFWTVHLRFAPGQWAAIEPRQIEPLEQQRGPGSRFELRNPAARRNGLSGVRGIEFDWVHGTLEFEDRSIPDVAIRYKGNGTYLRSQQTAKRPFKVDLDEFSPNAPLAGRTTLNFANLVVDDSCLHDTLGYEMYRDAGVPAPRTSFARLFLTTGDAPPDYLGVYALVENVDKPFAEERFGTRQGALFKPVTTELFSDLGDDWSAYDGIYDPKNRLTRAQSDRVIEFARLLTHADDSVFAARVGEFVDLEEFARFLAVTVLLSSYDGFLNNGQNFCLWLSPDTRQFQFIPWDLDNAWGKFGSTGSAPDRAQASIRRPWMGRHRLLERIMAVPEFERRYLQSLETLLATVFIPERLHRRVDELAALLRPVVAEESPRKFARFEQAVSMTSLAEPGAEGREFGRNRRPHPLKWFITERARSVREQLAGTSEGVILERWR